MDTLYLKNRLVYYFFEDTGSATLADIYNHIQMTYTPNGLIATIAVTFVSLGVSKYIPKSGDRFTLVLDFLGNAKTTALEDVADYFKGYLKQADLPFNENNITFSISVPGLKLEDIASIVCNERFQKANIKINASPSNAWKVFIEN